MARPDVPSKVTSVIVVALISGCGGTTTTGTERHIDVGNGGDASVGGSDSGRIPFCNQDGPTCGLVNGTGGTAGTGGVTESRGGTAAGGTAPDPCAGVRCASPNCPAGSSPVTPPGQCCPTSCGPSSSADAGSCSPATPPVCAQNTYPPCAPDWSTAQSWFTTCGLSGSGGHLARCGRYDAVVDTSFDSSGTYLYDTAGKLVGSQNSYSCTAYDPSFVPLAPLELNSCIPVHPCPADGGTHASISDVPCPGLAGPSMVRVPAADGTTYCIDSTEVTNRQYAEFLSAKKSGADGGTDTSAQDYRCTWNASYEPPFFGCVAQYDPYASFSRPHRLHEERCAG